MVASGCVRKPPGIRLAVQMYRSWFDQGDAFALGQHRDRATAISEVSRHLELGIVIPPE